MRVYDGSGVVETKQPVVRKTKPRERTPTIADHVPVTAIMSADVVCARADLPIEALIALMMRHRVGCVPIVNQKGRPIGMVSRSDLVEQMGADFAWRGTTQDLDPEARRAIPHNARDLMRPLAWALDDGATVGEAAAMLSIRDLRELAVVADDGTVIGIVSSHDIVRWLADNDGFLPRSG